MFRPLVLAGALLFSSMATVAQDSGFIERWLSMVTKTQAEQPHWVTPLVTVTPRLEQEFRYDVLRQTTATGHTLWNFGNGKGLELIPQRSVEVIFNLPPYLMHNDPLAHDGFGDTTFLLKYRLLAANEEHGSYIVTLFLSGSVPTGSYRNGSTSAVVTPTISAGKSWGKFIVQTTLGAGLPVDETDRIGHAIAWNTAFQYHARRFLWPELEVNSTFWKGGSLDGKKQVFLTPGLVAGRIPIHNRVGLTMGVGMQIAATHFHNFDHNLVITARNPF